ncbi:MAG: hypothetical protein QME81_13920 [bacterium]|nr:hypothetical protein [bacterium]
MNYFLAVLSGGFLVLSFPPYDLWPLAWIGLVPGFIAIRASKTRLKAAVLGGLTYLVFFSGLLFWIRIYHLLALPFTLGALTLYGVVFGLILKSIENKRKGSFIAPFVWVGIEFIRSLGVLGFPWGILGYSQYKQLTVIQVADITGVWGVSFLIVWVNSYLANLYLAWRKSLPAGIGRY